MDVIVAIGHDKAGPDFAEQVRQVIERLGTLNATIGGVSSDPTWGVEEATWFAASFDWFPSYTEARERILAIAAAHNQDAVAFTIGTTEVATVVPSVATRRAYRDLL